MKKLVILSLFASMLTLVGCSSQSANQNTNNNVSSSTEKVSEQTPTKAKTMKIALTVSKDVSYTKELYKFAEKVEKESGGSLKVEIYPDGTLGTNTGITDGLVAGTIEATMTSPASLTSYAKRMGALELPYLFKDRQSAYQVLDGPIGQELLNDLPNTGMVGISYWENGFRHLTNDKREVKSIDDIKGLKLRTLQSEVHIDLWKGFGAIPTPMSFTELFTAMEQHVVDGQENPAILIKTSKFYEVQKYLTTTGHIYSAQVFLVSKKFWDSLSDQEKEIITKAAEEGKAVQRKLAEQEDKEALEYLRQQGMTITDLESEEKQKLMDKARSLYPNYKSIIGEDLLKKLLEATK